MTALSLPQGRFLLSALHNENAPSGVYPSLRRNLKRDAFGLMPLDNLCMFLLKCDNL